MPLNKPQEAHTVFSTFSWVLRVPLEPQWTYCADLCRSPVLQCCTVCVTVLQCCTMLRLTELLISGRRLLIIIVITVRHVNSRTIVEQFPANPRRKKTKQQRLTVGFIMLFIVQMKISTPSENLSKTKSLEGIKI